VARMADCDYSQCRLAAALAAGGLVLGASATLAAQSLPPVRATIALEGTMKKIDGAANHVIVTTADGMEHVFEYTKNLLVHGGPEVASTRSRFRNGTSDTFQFSNRAAIEAGAEIDRDIADATRISLYYSDEAGRRVVYFFKKSSYVSVLMRRLR
jgi:hypothetical protein